MTRAVVVVLALALASGCGRVGFVVGEFDGGAGQDDAVVIDANADAGFQSLCSREGMIICEDFEGAINPKWEPKMFNGAPAPALSPNHPYQGGLSLETVTNNPGETSYWAWMDSRLEAATDLYARVWVYLPDPDVVGHANIITLQHQNIGFSLLGNQNDLSAFSDPTLGFPLQPINVHAPRGTWFCMELQVHRAVSGTVKGTVNGGLPSMSFRERAGDTTDTGRMEVDVGVAYSGPDQMGTLHMFIDNVIVTSGDPVGCYP